MMEPLDNSAVESAALENAALESAALDGNAIGGLLIEVFGTEMTTAVGVCASCGRTSQVAELAVYLCGLGAVVRCRGCDGVLMVFVRVRGIMCVDLQGLASLALCQDGALFSGWGLLTQQTPSL